MYLLLFLVGFFGFVAMTALGFIHVGHGGGHGPRLGGGHGNHASQLGHHGPASHSVQGHVQGQAASPSGHGRGGTPAQLESRLPALLLAISPIDLFSLAMGAGAVGLLLHSALAPTALAGAACVGALLFAFGVIRPLMTALSNMASRPSLGLEGMVAQTAIASTRFDTQGRGLITIQLDGQNRQVLARLESDELSRGVRVGKGDPVTIIEVDETSNVCRVTRELAS